MADVSIVLNVHRESTYVRRTIHSLADAALHARKVGLDTELVVVLDRSDVATINAVKAAQFDGFSVKQFIEVDHGSLGLARNAGIAASSADYVWLADADDLVSANSITAMHAIARDVPRSVIFPEYLVAFGEAYWIARYFDDSIVTAADFAYGHPYISRIFIRKKDLDGLIFRDLRLSSGFAYEDWHFNSELRARGMRFCVASRTIFFYRQRKGSLLRQANAISVGQIPHSTLFDPEIFSARVAQEEVDLVRAERERRRDSVRISNWRVELLSDPLCRAMVIEAAEIDPGINFELIEKTNEGWSNVFPNRHWGHDYAEVCTLIAGRQFTDIVLLPNLGAGGAEKYILDVLRVLAEEDVGYRGLVITGEAADHHAWIDRLPIGTAFIDLFNAFPWLNEEERDLLLLRLVTAKGRGARLHLKSNPFAHRWFAKFGGAISKQTLPIYYRFSDQRIVVDDRSIELGWSFDFLSTEIENIGYIVSDHRRIVDHDCGRIGVYQGKWHCLYASHKVVDDGCKGNPDFSILWASRLSEEKMPTLLPKIVRAVREVLPKINFVVMGGEGLGSDALVEKFHATPGLDYRGPYDGFDSLRPLKFDALLYTSAFDGLPNVILEAMGHGLPVIAPDLGGIREAVQTGKTGWLLPPQPDEHMLVQTYVDAVLDLYGDWSRARQMGQAARELVRAQHSPEQHRRQVQMIFLRDGGKT